MKSLLTFVFGIVVAIGGIYLYQQFGPKEAKTPYLLELEISNGMRVPLKEGVTVDQFKNQLIKVDSEGKNGTNVNIKPEVDSKAEIEGPLENNEFKAPNRLEGPERSVHNTQRIAAANMEDLQSVLALLGSSSAQTPPAVSAPTPTPTP